MLCINCADIDINWCLGAKIEVPIRLGTIERIHRNRECSFCRLVAHALASGPFQRTYDPRTKIYLNNQLSWKLGIEYSPYDGSKSDAYSNKHDLESHAEEIHHPAYRLLVTDTRYGRTYEAKFAAHIQYLAYEEKQTKQKQQFFGRLVLPERFSIRLLRSWIDLCERWHGDSCDCSDYEMDRLPPNLRLIDVRKSQIVRARNFEFPEYVVLSYVWGTEAMIKETGMKPARLLKNIVNQYPRGEPIPLPEKVPATIKDAIKLTGLLGYRYLWVDALCIVQDETFDEKLVHLENMKAIYSCASLTIAAAAGTHADYGIPGLSSPRASKQYSERVQGLALATMFPSYTDLDGSSFLHWNTRCWTFQEQLLSKRLLLFTDSQVYFKCSEAIWTEEIVMETRPLSKTKGALPRKYRWEPDRPPLIPPFFSTKPENFMKIFMHRKLQSGHDDDFGYLRGFMAYAVAIQKFTKRTLTDKRDMLFAISGVLETMEPVIGRCILGLPEKYMLEALLWYPELGALQFPGSFTDLPSWTWAQPDFERRGAGFDMMDIRVVKQLFRTSSQAIGTDSEHGSLMSEKFFHGDEPHLSGALRTFSNFTKVIKSFQAPSFQRGHTILSMFYFDGSRMKPLTYNLPITTFDMGSRSCGRAKRAEQLSKKWRSAWRPPSIRSLGSCRHVLVFESNVVRFRIGKSILRQTTSSEYETGLFDLLNDEHECVGEVKTTFKRSRSKGLQDFVTICWGLNLIHANLEDKYLPHWRLKLGKTDGASSSDDKAFKNSLGAELDISGVLADFPRSETLSRYSHLLPGFLDLISTLYKARKKEKRYKMLLPVVNLLLVDWHEGVARRAGVGKVIMGAWEEYNASPENIILA